MNSVPRLSYSFRFDPRWDALPIEAFAAIPDALCRIERWHGGPLLASDGRSGKAAALRALVSKLTDPWPSTTFDMTQAGEKTT